jgi:outer membrane protein TolC
MGAMRGDDAMGFWGRLFAVGLLAVGGAANAADPTVPKLASRGGSSGTLHGTLQLSLADAIAMGLENNLRVEIQRHAPIIAHGEYRSAWGAYDPIWSSEVAYSDTENPNANAILGTPGAIINTETIEGNTGFKGLVPWLNTSYDARLTSSSTKSDFAIAQLFPELRSEVSISLIQPLMRGLIWSQPWTLVRTTRVLEFAALEEFRESVMNTVQVIEDSYWKLIADEERVGVAEKSLETAQALLERVTVQYEVGVVSKVEIAESEAGEAERDFELIKAQNTYRNSMDELIDLVLGTNLTPDSSITIEPTNRTDAYVPVEVDVVRATQIAFERRPEIARKQHEIDRLILNLKLAKNERLPQLDAMLGYGNRGLAGTDLAGVDRGGYGDTFRQPGTFFGGNAAQQWSVGAVLSVPFPNTTGRSQVSIAELELRRARVDKRQQEQTVILEVRRFARGLIASQEGIEAAERRRSAAQEQLRAEEIRLEYGESTPFDVLLREEDLVSAEQGYIDAFQAYRSSLTNLDRAQGTILRNRNVEIDRVAPLR